MRLKKVKRLKRKYLIILTILIAMISLKLINFVNIGIQQRVNDIEKKIQACDTTKHRACTYYEIRNLNK